MSVPELELTGSYDPLLVSLSVVIAMFASYTALDLAGRVTSERGVSRAIWQSSGAAVMGIGIWAMHYVGMLAFRLPVPVTYDWPTVLWSLLAAIFASAIALQVTSSKKMGHHEAAVGSLFMGSGIAGMHYIGMDAMRLPAMCRYSPVLVAISVALAILVAWVALRLAYHFRDESNPHGWKRILSAMVMGAAIPSMHYTAMSAARFSPAPLDPGTLTRALSISSLGTVSIIVAALMIQGFAIFTTVVDRKLSLQANVLESTEERARQILTTSFDAFVEVDTDGRIADWNAQAERTFGWSRAEVAGKAFDELLIPTSCLEAYHKLATPHRSPNGGQSPNARFEIRAVCRDSREIPVEITLSGMPRNQGLYIAMFLRDLTSRERAEEKFKGLMESIGEATLIVDSEGRIAVLNSCAEKLFGYSRAELLNSSVEVLLPLGLRSLHTEQRNLFYRHPRVRPMGTGLDLTARRKDGSEFPVEISLSPLRTEEGMLVSALIMDITERKKAERELHFAKEAAEAASQAKSVFLATMSHEIRTPMNGILGMTELVLDTDLSGEQRENLDMVRVSAESLLTILNDILDFSKIEAGKMDLETIPFDLRDSLGETVRALGFRAQQKGLELICDVDPDVPEGLLGDPGRLRQILVNLVGNSIKFTERGEILIRVEEESKSDSAVVLHFSVKDTGVGIPADKQQKVFEPFSQADGSMARKYGGSGLGLAICTKLATLMGGRIWMESLPNEGSTFHFTCRILAQPNSTLRAEAVSSGHLQGLHALVVDDNLTNRRVLSGMLRNWGIAAECVEGGSLALSALQAARKTGQPFALVLLDGQMPEMDGFTLAGKMQDDPGLAGASIMMLTSAGQLGDGARCRELGISAYLSKPIRQRELFEAITSVLKNAPYEKALLVTRHTLREDRQRLRILLAEDNLINQKLAVRLLEKRGHSVREVLNGREAVRALETESFDLVLMDIQMPEMNGFEATAAIREREKSTGAHTPIIAMTANALKGDEEQCLTAGMDGYVSKPIRTQQLFATMESVLSHARVPHSV